MGYRAARGLNLHCDNSYDNFDIRFLVILKVAMLASLKMAAW
jgi:hypothetical protein